MARRKHIPKAIETEVLIASRRRCCLCFFLKDRDEDQKGQIAHLNRDPSDSSFENLVWLCLEHHDDYDGKTSQSKGFTIDEVRQYRNRLYAKNGHKATRKALPEVIELPPLPPTSEYELLRTSTPEEWKLTSDPWRYPFWQVANQPFFFAYKGGIADGVCLIERIDLPDGRIVVACIETAGNPGTSITNCVEGLCFQVCERFEIPADRLIWLQHYDYDENQEWSIVTFTQMPPEGPFANPRWTRVTSELWQELRLTPKKRLTQRQGQFNSKLTKLFHWPTHDLL
jgi:hypothetical protein